ncbi:MAG: Hpt domain-containing protein [Alphaproteobacteria bacterium]|nr:Hpt domain-containing protein [Alphaproteobacteria bacterium]MBF0129404.1 Hpt domain-containing protein [Alphaproteobacteria bacterium]
MADDKAEFIVPPNRLKSKVTFSEGGIDAAALEKAEQVIANLQGNYLDWVEEDLTAIQAAYEKAASDVAERKQHLADIFRIAHDMKGQGGSFGYQLITLIANQICRVLEKVENPGEDALEVIKVHIHAMRLVITSRMEGDGGKAGAGMVKGLEATVAKVLPK